MTGQLAYGLLIAALCVVLACRIEKMVHGVTQPSVFMQHFVLAVAAFASWVVGFTSLEQWNTSILSGGVLAFFLFSRKRWRFSAPDDTTKPGELQR